MATLHFRCVKLCKINSILRQVNVRHLNYCSTTQKVGISFSQGLLNNGKRIHWQQIRTAFRLPNPFRKRQNYRFIDDVAENFQCVYYSPVSNYLTYGYPTCVFIGVLTVALIVKITYRWNKDSQKMEFKFFKGEKKSVLSYQDLMVISTLVLLTLIIAWRVTAKTPIRIYYAEDRNVFTGVFATVRPWRRRKLRFEPGDMQHQHPVKSGARSQAIQLLLGEYRLCGRRAIITPSWFSLPYYYNLALGIECRPVVDDVGDE